MLRRMMLIGAGLALATLAWAWPTSADNNPQTPISEPAVEMLVPVPATGLPPPATDVAPPQAVAPHAGAAAVITTGQEDSAQPELVLPGNQPIVDPIDLDPGQLERDGGNGVLPTAASCLVGVSKNLCNGLLLNGSWQEVVCGTAANTTCRTLVGRGATLQVMVQNNPDGCSNTPTPVIVRCDESPTLSGPLSATLDFRLRLGDACQTRGAFWGNYWMSANMLPVIAVAGSMEGTAGVGTDRPVRCLATSPTPTCGSACETCAAARFDAANNRWTIPVEGVMRGRVAFGPHAGCVIRVSMSGTFSAPGTIRGPIPPDQLGTGWFFCGAMDGILECPCRTN